jgi:hypothetical protein
MADKIALITCGTVWRVSGELLLPKVNIAHNLKRRCLPQARMEPYGSFHILLEEMAAA